MLATVCELISSSFNSYSSTASRGEKVNDSFESPMDDQQSKRECRPLDEWQMPAVEGCGESA